MMPKEDPFLLTDSDTDTGSEDIESLRSEMERLRRERDELSERAKQFEVIEQLLATDDEFYSMVKNYLVGPKEPEKNTEKPNGKDSSVQEPELVIPVPPSDFDPREIADPNSSSAQYWSKVIAAAADWASKKAAMIAENKATSKISEVESKVEKTKEEVMRAQKLREVFDDFRRRHTDVTDEEFEDFSKFLRETDKLGIDEMHMLYRMLRSKQAEKEGYSPAPGTPPKSVAPKPKRKTLPSVLDVGGAGETGETDESQDFQQGLLRAAKLRYGWMNPQR